MDYHEPVLLQESIDLLAVHDNGFYVDGTLGGGGHSELILDRIGRSGRCIGFDVDPDAIAYAENRLSRFGNQFTAIRQNSSMMRESLYRLGISAVHGILLDLGVSSRQLDETAKGFTFRTDAPLDLRLNPTLPESGADLLNRLDVDGLHAVFQQFGEEPYSRKIATSIVSRARQAPIRTTGDLTTCIDQVIFPDKRKKTYARVFQAIRIAVNGELDVLDSILNTSKDLLLPGGRLVVISYHSLEDRMVKSYLRAQENPCTCPPGLPVCICKKEPGFKVLTRKAVVPSEAELSRNPRSRSARLRAGERLNG